MIQPDVTLIYPDVAISNCHSGLWKESFGRGLLCGGAAPVASPRHQRQKLTIPDSQQWGAAKIQPSSVNTDDSEHIVVD